MTADTQWNAADTSTYRALARTAVPFRAEQIAVLLTLIPFGVNDTFKIIELAAGEGYLADALLSAFPHAELTALDIEADMRTVCAERNQKHGTRCIVEPFDLVRSDWFHHLANTHVVLSSLCIHHLSGTQKQHLFRTICERTAPQGALLIADLVAPPRPEANQVFAATWDLIAERQSLEKTGTRETFQQFTDEQWNIYRYPDPLDTPSPLMAQLMGLFAAGYAPVDCFWMQAGHAIFGGYKGSYKPELSLDYLSALRIAEEVLAT